MTRLAGTVLLTFGLAVALLQAAQDPGPDKPDAPVRLKKNDKGEPVPAEEAGPDARTKELLARVAKNMSASEDRLKNQDPGDGTRRIQSDIVKDLDELIKKAQEREQQQSSGSSGGGMGSSKGGASQSRRKQSGQEAKSGGARPKQDGAARPKNGGQGKKGQAAAQPKKEQGNQGKEAAAGKSGGGGNDSQKRNTISDVMRTEKDIWGHLPVQKRQEMDAYAKDRFMPKYDELLRQYYRTISEQGRKKDGD